MLPRGERAIAPTWGVERSTHVAEIRPPSGFAPLALSGNHARGEAVARSGRVWIVVDTNVVVSALLKAGSVPARALEAMHGAGARWLYDARIEREYREVLGRRKFAAIPAERRDALLAAGLGGGKRLEGVKAWDGPMIDAADRPFVEVALAGRAAAILTGNTRHIPGNLGFQVLQPAELLAMLS